MSINEADITSKGKYIIIFKQQSLKQKEQNENHSQKTENNLNNLDNIDFTNKKIKINSPRSKKALSILGLNANQLYEISQKEYIDFHPELKKASEEVQNKRYEHFNNRRLKSIDEVRKVRKNIIEGVEASSDNNEAEKKKKEVQGKWVLKKKLLKKNQKNQN